MRVKWSSAPVGARPAAASPRCLRPVATTGSCAWWMQGSHPAQVRRDCRTGHARAGGSSSALERQEQEQLSASVQSAEVAQSHVGASSQLLARPVSPACNCTRAHTVPNSSYLDRPPPLPTGASLAIHDAHSTATNCLRWHPASEHLLLSASHDPAILLHDLRNPSQPLHRLAGHAQGARCAQGHGSAGQPACSRLQSGWPGRQPGC